LPTPAFFRNLRGCAGSKADQAEIANLRAELDRRLQAAAQLLTERRSEDYAAVTHQPVARLGQR